MSRMLDVSVIVPVWNDPDGIRRCVAYLAAQSLEPERFEVLVVDNGSEPPLSLPDLRPNMRLLVEPAPGSYAARNCAVRQACGSVLAFTDADCMPQPGWLAAGLAALEARRGPAFVGGRIVVTGAVPGSLRSVEAFEVVALFNQERQIRDSGFAAGANLIVPRSVMEAIGPFDEAVKSGGDRLWCQKAVAQGVEPVYAADAVVHHPARGSRMAILRRERRIAGGHRDADPGWLACLRFFLRHMLPPRRAILDILKLPRDQIGPASRCLAILVAIEARLNRAFSRLVHEVLGRPSPRA